MGNGQPLPASGPPRRLALSVALVAAAMLLLEIFVTRLFSVLFYYHFSFFAISLVMSGMVAGGLLAARWDARGMSAESFSRRLSWLASAFALSTLAALLVVVAVVPSNSNTAISLGAVALHAVLFLPGLVAAGAFLALALARRGEWVGALYAWDLLAAAGACVASIALFRNLDGTAVFLCPVMLAASATALLAAESRPRSSGLAIGAVAAVLLIADVSSGGRVLRLRAGEGAAGHLVLERWNEHSRIQAWDLPYGRYLVIDRSAGTLMPHVPPRPDGGPVEVPAVLRGLPQHIVYELERAHEKVAIIGVGGGGDLWPPVYRGAKAVHGYELNHIFIDLLTRDFRDYSALLSRPEVTLRHTEARVGIAHSHELYDVIQASLIDTWAATASGGFVLSENGLYTREGWATFLSHLTDTGVLTMTRWHVPGAPAETQRLVSLAATALSDAGIPHAGPHLLLVRGGGADDVLSQDNGIGAATILVSKAPFSSVEVERIEAAARALHLEIMARPGEPPADAVIRDLLSDDTRAEAVARSAFDISAPTDSRPYFFLQVRPTDLVNLKRSDFGVLTQVTFNGVRVLLAVAAAALAFVVAIVIATLSSAPGTRPSSIGLRVHRGLTVYGCAIGFGYILIQLGLHQRLIVVLGHPTLALSVVLFSMLLGTGAGAAYSTRLFPSGRLGLAGLAIVSTLAALALALPLVPSLERIDAAWARITVTFALVFGVGFVLGFAFPLGARRASDVGEFATQRLWAMNGAASIAATVVAALVGLTLGSAAVLASGLAAYVVATAAGWRVDTLAKA